MDKYFDQRIEIVMAGAHGRAKLESKSPPVTEEWTLNAIEYDILSHHIRQGFEAVLAERRRRINRKRLKLRTRALVMPLGDDLS